jgi:hypothetical protein
VWLLALFVLATVLIAAAPPLFALWEWSDPYRDDAARSHPRARPVAPLVVALPIALRGCGAGRCAYCHDDVAVEDRAACAACLAVHHEECWEGRCAACGAALSLRLGGSFEQARVLMKARRERRGG